MKVKSIQQVASDRLRRAADARAPTVIGDETLALLHQMAGQPDRAADAMRLLHELQVHQVELQLQAEELQATLAESQSARQRHAALFELAPVALFVVCPDTRILQANRLGAALVEPTGATAVGQWLSSHLHVDSQPVLADLLARAAKGNAEADVDASAGPLHLAASPGPDDPAAGATVLLAATPVR
jgi:PAS domain-containing protein